MESPVIQSTLKIAAVVLLVAGLVSGALTVRLFSQARHHLEVGLAALASGDLAVARMELEDAAKAYVPGSPYCTRALEELTILAKTAQMRGQPDEALQTWETLRRSVLATRHVVTPNAAFLERAEAEIVRLRQEDGMEDKAAHVTVARPADPSTWLSLLLALSFGAWILGAAAVAAGVGLQDGLWLRNAPGSRKLAWCMCCGGLASWLILAVLV